METKYKYVNKFDRTKLTEGRTHGLSFAMCMIHADGTLEAVSPMSTCKDYLSDQVWSEITGRDYTIYGFTSKRRGAFKDGKVYLAVSILPFNDGTLHGGYADQVKQLENKVSQIQDFCQFFDKEMQKKHKIEHLTTAEKIGDNLVLVTGDAWWTKYTYLISAYALIIRVAWSEGWDGKKDPYSVMNGVKTDDVYMMGTAVPRLKEIAANGAPHIDHDKVYVYPHNHGIYGTQGNVFSK